MLSVRNLEKVFGEGTPDEHKVLRGVDFVVNDGEFVAILGNNGAGKSTLLNCISGTYFVDEGQIMLDDKDVTYLPEHKRARYIGRLFQDPLSGTAPHMTIEENLALAYTRKASRSFFAVNRKDHEYFRELLSELDMGLENRMKTKMGLLSGGQRQAASLLMSTIAQPKLLLLDEHTAALDPGAAEKVMAVTEKIVARDRITTLMITHDMDYALSVGDRTIMLDSGRIVLDLKGAEREAMTSGPPAELVSPQQRPRR